MIYDTVDQNLVDLFLYLSKFYICLYDSLFFIIIIFSAIFFSPFGIKTNP